MVDKDVTVGGDVPHPLTVTAPVGTPMREVIALSGFTGAKEDYALIVGGPCMGKLEEDWDAPVTKTTGGLLMLRRTHLLIARRTQSPERLLKIARAVCCQCSQCTQMCPRNALGLHVEPHKAMRAITTGNGALLGNARSVLACSSCGVCTNYACHMGLSPSEVMAQLKDELGRAGIRPVPEADIRVDPFIVQKRVPVKRLIARMGLAAFDTPRSVHGRGAAAQTGGTAASPARGQARRSHGEARRPGAPGRRGGRNSRQGAGRAGTRLHRRRGDRRGRPGRGNHRR